MTAPLNHCRPYSSGYDNDGRYYEQWIKYDDENGDYDFHDEQSFVPNESKKSRVKANDD